MRIRIIIIYLIITGTSFPAKASFDPQNPGYAVAELSAADGLSQNDARVVVQDRTGYMWIGTNDGVNRYDGYEFKTYRLGDRGLASNLIRDISEDIHGNLWIGTEDRGLIYFNTATENFTNVYENTGTDILLPTEVNSVVTDGHGNAWIKADEHSVYRFRYDPDSFTFLIKQIKLPVNERYRMMTTNDSDDMVVLTYNGIFGYDEESPEYFRLVHTVGDVSDIQWKDGRIYVLKGNMAYLYDPISEEYTLLSDIWSSLMLAGSDNKLWLQNTSGIYCVDLDLEDYSNRTSLITRNARLITLLTEDCFGNIWVGTYRRGLMLIYKNYPFRTFKPGSSVECLVADSEGMLWVGEVTGRITRFEGAGLHDPITVSLPAGYNTLTQYILEHKYSGRIFIANAYGIFNTAISDVSKPSTFSRVIISGTYHLNEDGKYMWISSFGNGLSLYNTETGEIERTIIASPGGLPSNIVRYTMVDSKGNLWVTTMQGLVVITAGSRFEPAPVFRRVSFRNERRNVLNSYHVLSVHESATGDIWVGSLGMGLYRLSGIDENFTCDAEVFTTDNGLSNNIIRGLLEDDQNNMWVSTTSGLNSVSPDGLIRSFSKKDGLQDYEFRDLSCAKMESGELAFGGLGGFSIFDPEQIKENRVVPRLVITDFQVNNHNIRVGEEVGGRVILKSRLENNSSVKLKHNQNNFRFYFSALHYNVPESSKYMYKLEGHDKEWIETSSADRMAKYSNLPPGRYRFCVKGGTNDNTWSEVTSIDMTILAPIWARWYAYLLYVVTAIFSVLMFIHSMIKKQRTRDEIALAKREKQYLQELHESKMTFFTNVSHEFRTPLTLILSPLQKLLANRDMAPAKQEELLKAIDQNSNILLRLINQTMDFAKQDKEKLSLNLKKSDIVSFSREVFGKFSYLGDDKELTLSFSSNTERVFVEFDRDQMEEVLFNLISNAIKHTPPGGEVSCKVREYNESVDILITDTGAGVDEKIKDNIFEQFYSAESEYSGRTGTGIGLSLTRKLVEMHHGTISCESTPGEGATFTVSLPKVKYMEYLLEDSQPAVNSAKETVPKTEPGDTADNKATILVVDDSKEVVDMLENLLEDQYNILRAYDGRDGLEKCLKFIPTLVIADVMMPGMNGLEMCSMIKNDPAISHIPVLILTAKVSEDSQREGFSVLADAYCPKPFDNNVLCSMIASIITNRRNFTEKLREDFIYNSANVKVNTLHNDFIKQLIEVIDANLSTVDVSVGFFAKEMGTNQNFLNKRLKEITGQTAIAFIRSIKLKRAAEMLATLQYTVQEVTYATGFSDLRYFRQAFKKEFGVVPSEFTKKTQTPDE